MSASPVKMVSTADPTANVLALVDAAVTRLDDLHKAEMRRIDEMLAMQFEYIEKLNLAESRRIDAIRIVDVGAVAIASERAAAQALVLANQVSTSAETLRNLVASTATSVASSLQQVSGQLAERISSLEKAQYEGVGKGRVSDPALVDLYNQVKLLQEARSNTSGFGSGMEKMWGWIVAAAVAVFAIYSQLK